MLLDVAYKLTWEGGRQNTGYLKSPIDQNDSRFIPLIARSKELLNVTSEAIDCYIIKYPAESHIPTHKDDAPFSSNHFRLNAMIKNSVRGGKLIIEKRFVDIHKRDAIIFRPDILEHGVTKVKCGERYIWSVGVLK